MRAAAFVLLLLGSARAGDPLIEQAFEQLMRDDGDSRLAELILKKLPERAAVVGEAERALRNGVQGVRGKRRLLWFLLFDLEEGDLVARALAMSSLPAQRAAAATLAGQPEHAEATKAILLAWIAEQPPPDVALLVEACMKAKLAEARPWLRKLLDGPDTPPPVFANALAALLATPPPDLAEVVKARLANLAEDPTRIGACLDALQRLKDVDADDLLLPWLRQREHRIVRLKAAHAIRDPAALRQFLLDETEDNPVLQRNCFYRLMDVLDDSTLLGLLRDRRVTRNRYFAIRVDVCTALACVEGSGAPDVPLLLDYLVDEDPQDRDRIVRSEAWITLWTLTGEMHGAEGDFATPPRRAGKRFRTYRVRPGTEPAQRAELERLAKDLDHMRTVREAYAAAK